MTPNCRLSDDLGSASAPPCWRPIFWPVATPHHGIRDEAFRALAERQEEETGLVLSDAKRGLAVARLSRRLRALNLADLKSLGVRHYDLRARGAHI